MTIFSFCRQFCAAILVLGIAAPVFAESAPVYDADSIQQQFENAGPPDQELPMPPPPGQEDTFVPMSQEKAPPAPVSHPPLAQAPLAQEAEKPIERSIDHSQFDTARMSVDQRLARTEQQVTNLQNSASSRRIETLQNEVQSLRGQVEQLTRQLQQMQSQQKSMYSDLDKRLVQNQSTAPAAEENTAPIKPVVKSLNLRKPNRVAEQALNAPPAKPDQPNVAEEQEIYQTAYNFIKAKKYSNAVEALQKMLQKYPSGQFAGNAHYWLGELYGLMNKNDQALTEFTTVTKSYSTSPRVSDAQLKIGLIFASQAKWTNAKAAFKKVINSYPGTASARLASEQLKQIKEAGR